MESPTFGFLKKPDAQLEKGLRGVALTPVLSNKYASVFLGMLQEEQEPIEWKELHVGVERGCNCEHMKA